MNPHCTHTTKSHGKLLINHHTKINANNKYTLTILQQALKNPVRYNPKKHFELFESKKKTKYTSEYKALINIQNFFPLLIYLLRAFFMHSMLNVNQTHIIYLS